MEFLNLRNSTKRILFTILMIIAVYIGMMWSIPGAHSITSDTSKSVTDLIMSNNFSWFMMGATPYITADMSILILSSGISPMFTQWKKEGINGVDKLKKAKYVIAAIFSFMFGMIFIKNAITSQTHIFLYPPATSALMLTVGSLLLIYIADKIDEYGIGMGMSLIILFTAGRSIIVNLITVIETSTSDKHLFGNEYFTILLMSFILVLFTVAMICYDNKKKIIKVNDDNSDSRFGESEIAFLYNSAGITPVFFTSIILSFLSNLLVFEDTNITFIINKILFYISFTILMFICSYLRISPKKRAKKMNLQGLFIPDILPGDDTYKYLKKEVIKTTAKSTAFLIGCDLLMQLLHMIPCLKHWNIDTMTLLLVGIIINTLIKTIKVVLFENQQQELLY